MAPLVEKFSIGRKFSLLALCILLTAPAVGRANPAAEGPQADEKPVPAAGRVVAELDGAVLYVFQAKDGAYWFGSDDRGVYRYKDKSLVNFTTKDGLVSNRIRGIQEDAAGGVYFTTYEGISKYDGRNFTTLGVAAGTAPTDWKKRPGDLWFVGPPDAGIVYRYDGKSLHRLEFPKTKLGDDHIKRMPRSRFPNAIYSPYDVYCIVTDSRGNLWFGTSCVGVCRYDGTAFEWFTDKVLAEAPVRSILEDKKGNFWFTYSGNGTIDGFRPVENFGTKQPGAAGTVLAGMSVIEDADGKLWTAALRDGVYRYDGTKKTRHPITANGTAISVFAISKDNRGTLWLGTHNGGAYKYNGTTFEKFRP